MTTYYKFLNANERSSFQGYHWSLPTEDAPGEWAPEITGALVMCRNGYHSTTIDHATEWLDSELYELEYDGEVIKGTVEHPDKVVGRRARLTKRVDNWNERTARLFAADCAEHVLHLFENKHPNDDRPRKAIQAARDFANGMIDADEMAAAGVAAREAAAGDAWDAGGAAKAAWAAAAAAAAWDDWIVWDAAWDAARAAGAAAAGAAEHEWQTARLTYYINGADNAKRGKNDA